MVREFHANPRDIKELQCYMRGKSISFDRHTDECLKHSCQTRICLTFLVVFHI